jgi:hypothetical protein
MTDKLARGYAVVKGSKDAVIRVGTQMNRTVDVDERIVDLMVHRVRKDVASHLMDLVMPGDIRASRPTPRDLASATPAVNERDLSLLVDVSARAMRNSVGARLERTYNVVGRRAVGEARLMACALPPHLRSPFGPQTFSVRIR